MKAWHYILIAAAVVIGFLLWRSQTAKAAAMMGSPESQAAFLKGPTVIPQTPVALPVRALPAVANYAQPISKGTGGNIVAVATKTAQTVAANAAQAGCAALGGGPLCGLAGGAAGAAVGVGSKAVVGVAKAGAAVISKLKFW